MLPNALRALLLSASIVVAGPVHAAAQKLLLVSVVSTPTQAQSIAIYNPNATAVALDRYFLSDSFLYYQNVQGTQQTDSDDFVAQFPAGSSIGPFQTQVIAIQGAECFKSACGTIGSFTGFNVYPTYEIPSDNATHNSASVADMGEPAFQSLGSTRVLSDVESVVLFYWDGLTDLVTDVDYVYYGGAFDNNNPVVDKTGATSNLSTYKPDTPRAGQREAPVSNGSKIISTSRVDFAETGQVASGGNGVGGSDETSENNAAHWAGTGDFPFFVNNVFRSDFESPGS